VNILGRRVQDLVAVNTSGQAIDVPPPGSNWVPVVVSCCLDGRDMGGQPGEWAAFDGWARGTMGSGAEIVLVRERPVGLPPPIPFAAAAVEEAAAAVSADVRALIARQIRAELGRTYGQKPAALSPGQSIPPSPIGADGNVTPEVIAASRDEQIAALKAQIAALGGNP
jgi:hypothetical protein